MMSLSDDTQADFIEVFNSASRYQDDLLNIDNPYFEKMVNQIYSTELQFKEQILLIPKPHFFIFAFINFKRFCVI